MAVEPTTRCRDARFTVITESLIRLEWDPSGVFTDEPTLFAECRDRRCEAVRVDDGPAELVIETAALRLVYRKDVDGDGRLTPETCAVTVRETGGRWVPGKRNRANLGGPLATLDEVGGPVPLPDGLLARDGWYCHDDAQTHRLVDGWAAERRCVPTPRMNWRSDYPQDLYLFAYGSDYQRALRDLAAIGGPVPLPPRALLGSWYCRWHPYTADDYRDIVREYRERGYQLDVLVFDMDWHRLDASQGMGHAGICMGWTGWSWDRELLPDAEDLLAELKADGLKIALNVHPHDGVRPHEDCYEAFARDLGVDPASRVSLPLQAGDRRYMHALFQHAHHPREEEGVDLWWVDWQQDAIMPYVAGLGYLRHQPWLNRLYYHNARRDARRGVSFSRWGGWGDHKHPLNFSGDVHCTWPALAFEVEFTLRSGNAGCFLWSHDLGGFVGERNGELYARWLQFGVFSAVFRLHSLGDDQDRRPWTWEQPFQESLRRSFRLRTAIFPTLYSAVVQCHREMLPLLRPLYLDHPDALPAYDRLDQYLFGDHLLIAPIVEPGAGERCRVARECWLPPGAWYDYHTGELCYGPGLITREHDIDTHPIFVRAGAVLVEQDPDGAMASRLPDRLHLRCYAPVEAAPVTSVFYEDDGETEAYRDGVQHRCAFTTRRTAEGGIALDIDPSGAMPWRAQPPALTAEWIGCEASAAPSLPAVWPLGD